MSGIRQAREADYDAVIAAVREWWADVRSPEAARELTLLLPRLFLQHCARTSLVTEGPGGRIDGFLVGFHSADRRDEAYIHFVGVRPQARGAGVARRMYERFFAEAAAAGRGRVRSVTSPGNERSIAFHRAMGFVVEQGADGSTVRADYDGPGQDRVCFLRDAARRDSPGGGSRSGS